MYAWGTGKDGQLGLGTKEDQTRPAALPQPVPNAVSVAVGPRMNVALTSEGELYSWGKGLMGELGLAYVTQQEWPAKITKVAAKFKAVAVGYEHTLAVSEGGDIYVWGANDLGQLGTGDLKPLDRPTKLKLPQKFVSVAAGTKHSLALTEHGFLYIWGGGWSGQVGDGESKSFLTPRLVSEDLTFKYIAGGDYCSLAITNRGKVYTWGSGSHGRLGHGDVKPQLVPKVIDHLTKKDVTAVKVVAGYDHMLLLSDKGEIWAWGAGAHGETAQNSSVRKLVPHPVLFYSAPTTPSPQTPPPQDGVSSGTSSSSALSTDPNGTATSDNGTTATTTSESSAVTQGSAASQRRAAESAAEAITQAFATHGPFVDIGIGRNFSVAINQRGECYTWGAARNGVLGNGVNEGIVALATKIESDVKFTKIFVSRDHVIALGSGEGAPIAQKVDEPAPNTTEPSPDAAAPSTPVN